ncbi:hypothetical protein RJ640_030771 [Escallonia rubra]|uniref:Myb-like domain-containing protein n=1 Tax=Escallonia rubra TaxID=112253 RepID=A0AA88UJC8_9ASTE|nr:hypothetical protein RJ640_030771 [Escallonia rubra]
MMIEVTSNGTLPLHHHPHHHPILLNDTSSGGEDNTTATNSHNPDIEIKAPKKRAETWVQEETRTLISLRRETDLLFNTSKSNRHLWDQISGKMRDKGFDRSPTMCTDKWRNLLKEFKKAKQQQDRSGGNGPAKMSYYKEIDEILGERSRSGAPHYKSPSGSKVEAFMQFSDKGANLELVLVFHSFCLLIKSWEIGVDDTNIAFGPAEGKSKGGNEVVHREISIFFLLYLLLKKGNSFWPSTVSCWTANGRAALNLERRLDHDGHPLAITAADAVTASGVSPWNWRDTPGNGEQSNSYDGRVITVKLGDYTKRIGIDGTADAIKEAIKSAFRLRTKRAFWLEDEDNIVRTLDREMPLGNYILHVDEGLTIKVCLYEEPDHIPVHTEDKTFYTQDDFRDFLSRRGWTCLREYNGYRNIDSMDELCPGGIYRGVN